MIASSMMASTRRLGWLVAAAMEEVEQREIWFRLGLVVSKRSIRTSYLNLSMSFGSMSASVALLIKTKKIINFLLKKVD